MVGLSEKTQTHLEDLKNILEKNKIQYIMKENEIYITTTHQNEADARNAINTLIVRLAQFGFQNLHSGKMFQDNDKNTYVQLII